MCCAEAKNENILEAGTSFTPEPDDVKDMVSPKNEPLDRTVSNDSSVASMDDISLQDSWFFNQKARKFFIGLLTIFYCIITLTYAVILELRDWITDEKLSKTDVQNFNYYMYAVSFLFFAWWYGLVLWRSRLRILSRPIKTVLSKLRLIKAPDSGKVFVEKRPQNDMPNIGSLYLRFGAVVFAIVGCVFYSYSAYTKVWVGIDICAIIFTIIQTHFIFCSSSLFDLHYSTITRFGTMHLVSTNLYPWFQFLFVKSQSSQKMIVESYSKVRINRSNDFLNAYVSDSSFSSSESSESSEEPINRIKRGIFQVITTAVKISNSSTDCVDIECLGSFTKVFYTAIVEYSLIAAVVMFIVWQNTDRLQNNHLLQRQRSHKKRTIRIGCSKTVGGMLAGFTFLTGTLISMAFFYVFSAKSNYREAANVYFITDMIQHLITTLACVLAFWQIRNLFYVDHDKDHEIHANQELLDMILLAIGLLGEMIYSIAGLMGLCISNSWESLSIIILISHICRITQTILQCSLITMAMKLRLSSNSSKKQPGKQTITFLIIANISMFIMNSFEIDKIGVSDVVINFYGEASWVLFIRIFSPLTVFFQFHSSVCLAEIWKVTFAKKH